MDDLDEDEYEKQNDQEEEVGGAWLVERTEECLQDCQHNQPMDAVTLMRSESMDGARVDIDDEPRNEEDINAVESVKEVVVVFRLTESHIEHVITGQRFPMRRTTGVFVLMPSRRTHWAARPR